MGQLGDLSPQASIAVGILVGLLSTSIQSLGLTLQRKSHLIEDDQENYEVRRPPYKRRRWQLGMGMFILSNIVGSTIQITTLPLPVLSTLQASGLVFNTAFATLLLNEPFTRFSLVGTILTCTGAALIAVFGAIGEPAHNLEQLLELLVRKQFIIWMIATFVIVIGTLVLAHFLHYWTKRMHESHPRSKPDRSPSASRSKTRQRTLTIALPRAIQLRASRLKILCGLAYALISGILSAHSLLIAKSAVELLVRTIVDHVNQFNSYQSWLILLALIFFALTQLYYLHLGLRLCSTSVLYPFVFCIYNIVAILDGLIYFHQTSRLSALHACLIALGTVILLSGVLALSWRLDDGLIPEPQPTPLGPGLGFVPSVSEDRSQSPSSPLLPTTRAHRSGSKGRGSTSVGESTPLLSSRRPSGGRKPPFMIYPPPPETGDPRQVWAELDDSNESDRDVLASLPRSASPFLSPSTLKPRRRSRGDSLSSPEISTATTSANGLWDRSSSGDGLHSERAKSPYKLPRRSQTLKERTYEEKRRSSAPSTGTEIATAPRSDSTSSSSPGSSRKSPAAAAPAIAGEGNLSGSGGPHQRPRGMSGHRERVRGRARSATGAPATPAPWPQRVVPSRWDMGVGGSVARWWQGQGQEQEHQEEQPRGNQVAQSQDGGGGGDGPGGGGGGGGDGGQGGHRNRESDTREDSG